MAFSLFCFKDTTSEGVLSEDLRLKLEETAILLERFQHLYKFIIKSQFTYLSSLCKFSYVSQRIFLYLIYNGFCGKEEAPPDNEEQAADDKFFEASGCGMGEGKGEENVSGEIEHEE